MSDARTKRLNESDKPALDMGIADNQHKLIIPQNTTANLAQITPEPALIAYDTTLGKVVVSNGSVFVEVGGDLPANTANKTLSNLTSPTAVNQDLNLSGNEIHTISQMDNISITPGAVYLTFTASGTTVITAGTSHIHVVAHGLTNNQAIRFSVAGGSLPSPLAAGVTYYTDTAITTPLNNFAIRTSFGGSPITLTTTGSGTVTVAAPPTTNYNDITIGASLVPLLDNTVDLGDASTRWANIYANSIQTANPASNPSIDVANAALRDSAGAVSLAWDSRYVQDSSTITSVDWQNRLLENSAGSTLLNWTTDLNVNAPISSNGGLTLHIADGTNLIINQDVTTANPVGIAMFDQTGSAYAGWRPPNLVTTPTIWALPVQDGVAGAVLTTDGAGSTRWSNLTTVRLVTATGPVLVADRKLILEDLNALATNVITLPAGIAGMTFTVASTFANAATWSFSTTGGNTIDTAVQAISSSPLTVTFLNNVWYNL